MKQNDTLTEAPPIALAELKHINLVDIDVDPNQPRKFFSKAEMDELTDSIREKGVIQAITVRLNPRKGKTYMLVCGERRFRASISVMATDKTRNTIPASIQDLTDDEALQLQIVENLQRKDVHPMEEAVAFKSLLDKNKDVHDIAARVGKSDFYVRQRLKLNNLTKKWQDAFYAGRITNINALSVAVLEKTSQDNLFKDEGDGGGKIEIKSHHLNEYRGLLQDASFDIADPTLKPKMGACTNCQFNSSCASLFPDTVSSPKCSNITCFKDKSEIHFKRAYDAAIIDPEIILVHSDWNKSTDKFVQQAEKSGLTVLPRNSYEEASKPEAVEDFETWRDEGWHDDEDDEESLREEYANELADYKKDLEEYEKKIAGGKYKKAFCIAGNDRGKYLWITINKEKAAKAGSSANTKAKEVAGKLTAKDIDEEIARLNEREKRAKELDVNKAHTQIQEGLVKQKKHLFTIPQQPQDRGIMIFLLLELSGRYITDQIRKVCKSLPKEPGYSQFGYSDEYFAKLGALPNDELANLVRTIVIEKWGNPKVTKETRSEDTAIKDIAKYAGVDVKSIELAQIDAANKRQAKLKARLDNLRQQKKDLSTKKPAVKAKK